MNKVINKLSFNSNFRFLNHNGYVVMGNISNGLWIKCPEYIYDFLNKCVADNFSIEEVLGECQDIQTKEYMEQLVNTLERMEVINTGNRIVDSTSEIRSVTLELTTGCNLKCIHCCGGYGEIVRENMSFKDVQDIIKWCEENRISSIAFTGGEIFVRKDIWDILRYARTNFSGNIEIMTNGTLIKKEMVQFIKDNVDCVSISLDGYDDESVTSMRGTGVFDKVIHTIKNLQEVGMNKISLSMVVTKELIPHKKTFKNLCSSLGVEPITRVFTPEGRGGDNYDILYPTPKPINVEDLSHDNNKDLQNTIDFKSICNLNKKIIICSNGDIYPCFLTKDEKNPLGNISDLLNGRLQKIKLPPIVETIKPCDTCNVRYFCASPCVGQDANIYLQENRRTVVCNQMKEHLQKVVWGNDNDHQRS